MAHFGSIKRLRTDNRMEFTNFKFKGLLIRHKIKQEFSVHYSSYQNFFLLWKII